MQQNPILTTKLFIPFLRTSLVSRPRLIQRMNAGLGQGSSFARKLTLISAPAGFGKTTLVSEWIQAIGKAEPPTDIAWLSLDESDNDPTRFLTYFITALNQTEGMESTLGEGVLSTLQSPQPPPIETILTSLINEIATIPDRIILILDDYHLIDTKPIHDALAFLLDHLPPQMHMVIATREDPPLPLSRLRARGQLTELRAVDLRFSSSEAAEFLNQVMCLNLSEEHITALETRTEGWIAGLQLASLALQGTRSMQELDDTTSFIKSFTGSHRFVLDYLIEEVLEQQPENIQTFLLQTAVLDRLTGELCDALRFGCTERSSSSKRTAITGLDNGQTILEILERANLFIIPLDNERRWYRYHHLFADLLRQRLRKTQPEQIPILHLRASVWYEQQNLTPDAVHYALAAEDFERAAALTELAWPEWSGNIATITWFGWANALPEELVRARPVLCVAYAQALLNAGMLEAAEDRLIDAERWLEPATEKNKRSEASSIKMVVVDEKQFQMLPAWLATTRAYHAQAIGDVRGTVKYVERALELFPEDNYYSRAAVTGLLALANWANGDLEAAYRIFSDGLFQNVNDLIKGTFVLADMKKTLGQLREAETICQHGLQLAKAYDPPLPVGTEDIYSGISDIHREQGNLEIAAQDLRISKKLGDQVELPDWQYRWFIARSQLEISLGNLDIAIDMLDEASRVYVRTPLPDLRPIAAMKARIWVRQGRLNEALRWAREQSLSVDDNLSFLCEFEHISLAKVLIAQNKSSPVNSSLHKVMELVESLLHAAEQTERTGSLIEILILQALALEAQDDIPPALVSLERALTLAEPEGYLRLFVDEGPPMARLLYAALSRGIASEYVRRLLAAFPVAEPEHTTSSPLQIPKSAWVEPLSEREIEVLRLISEGLTNQEIASRLYLSVNTVKGHTRNIYGKLNVHSRTQAVGRSQELGLLPAK